MDVSNEFSAAILKRAYLECREFEGNARNRIIEHERRLAHDRAEADRHAGNAIKIEATLATLGATVPDFVRETLAHASETVSVNN